MYRTSLSVDAESIFRAGVKAVDPRPLVKEHLKIVSNPSSDKDYYLQFSDGLNKRRYSLEDFDRILVIGAGKASATMAQGIEDVLGDKIDDGLVVVKYGHTAPLERIRTREAGHPIPDSAGLEGSKEIFDLRKSL